MKRAFRITLASVGLVTWLAAGSLAFGQAGGGGAGGGGAAGGAAGGAGPAGGSAAGSVSGAASATANPTGGTGSTAQGARMRGNARPGVTQARIGGATNTGAGQQRAGGPARALNNRQSSQFGNTGNVGANMNTGSTFGSNTQGLDRMRSTQRRATNSRFDPDLSATQGFGENRFDPRFPTQGYDASAGRYHDPAVDVVGTGEGLSQRFGGQTGLDRRFQRREAIIRGDRGRGGIDLPRRGQFDPNFFPGDASVGVGVNAGGVFIDQDLDGIDDRFDPAFNAIPFDASVDTDVGFDASVDNTFGTPGAPLGTRNRAATRIRQERFNGGVITTVDPAPRVAPLPDPRMFR